MRRCSLGQKWLGCDERGIDSWRGMVGIKGKHGLRANDIKCLSSDKLCNAREDLCHIVMYLAKIGECAQGPKSCWALSVQDLIT